MRICDTDIRRLSVLLFAVRPGFDIEAIWNTKKDAPRAFFESLVAFAGGVFEKRHITDIEMGLGAVRGFDVDLAGNSHGELAGGCVVQGKMGPPATRP